MPILAVILPFIGLFIGKRFERKDKQAAGIDSHFNEMEDRINMCELKLARLEGRINGKS